MEYKVIQMIIPVYKGCVEECKTMDYNPIAVFKQQGQEQDNEMNDMGENDFLLGMQIEFH